VLQRGVDGPDHPVDVGGEQAVERRILKVSDQPDNKQIGKELCRPRRP
jgi:hypothetical protein